MACYNIMAVIINHRTQKAIKVQEVLTNHGCSIKMRLGLHEAGDVCSDEGLVILQLCGDDNEVKALESDLNSLEGVKAKTINICSD
ncbi:MAG: hypothetical protein N3B21_05920 [Clostridia bacterium]|nr:hypothetical protein [Clostridia bacterium]